MTLLYTHPLYLEHEVPPGHPECPERLAVITTYLQSRGVWDEFQLVESPEVEESVILKTHPRTFLSQLLNLVPEQGLVRIDQDTGLSRNSMSAVYRAVGAVVDAVEQVMHGADKRAFCLVRPPGHHAETNMAMGFCLLNGIAIAAQHALEYVDRVAILDFDVHHCNGTVEIFQDRSDVMVCSSFQYPFFPGRFDRPRVYGENIINTPLAAGSGSYEFRYAVEMEWLPALERFKPNLILVSAGFDAHVSDPLGALNFVDEDYAWITREIIRAADLYADGRVVSVLEGGYNLQTLGTTVEQHLVELLSS